MGWMNRQDPYSISVPISSVAANAEQEVPVACFSNDIRILQAYFVQATAIVTDTTSGFAMQLRAHDTGGTLSGTLATYTATTAAATVAATVPITLSATTTSTLPAGHMLTYAETTIGTGTARANGVLNVEYIHL
jgi:lysozyme family protein